MKVHLEAKLRRLVREIRRREALARYDRERLAQIARKGGWTGL